MTTVARSNFADPSPPRPGRAAATLLALALGAFGCSGSISGDGNGGPGPTNGGPMTPNGMNGMPGAMTPGTPGNPGTPGTPGAPGTPGSPGVNIPVVPPLPGHTPMRRLTRSQYNNTIQDLLGIVGDAAADFGVDEDNAGFASNATAPLNDGQIEKYQQVAEQLADKAVANLGALMKCPAGAAEDACVDSFVRGFGKRALRRPLTDAEVTRYKTLYTTGRTGGDMSTGVSLVISALLQSPYFLYRIELGEPGATGATIPLTAYEVATRLSYFMTDSTPDDALLAAADAGKLKTPEGIAAEAQRMLSSPAAKQTLVSFYTQWLGVDDLGTIEKDAKAYPIFTPEVRAAMRDEVLEFVDQNTRLGDGKLATILTGRNSFIRGPLNPVYGLPAAGAAGGSIQKPYTHKPDQRAGVFTLAGVMAEYGHADQSSPVGRGKVVSERLLCQVPPDPPPGIANNVPPPDPNVPTRVRFEKHRTDPQCSSCHALLDPMGVPFEFYDGMGVYRTTDGGKPVDGHSEIKGTKASDGPVANAIELMTKLSAAQEVQSCFTRQMFRYAFGRAEQDFDKPLLDSSLMGLTGTGRIPDLMTAIATAAGFRTRIPVALK
jgi:hypothetical protein